MQLAKLLDAEEDPDQAKIKPIEYYINHFWKYYRQIQPYQSSLSAFRTLGFANTEEEAPNSDVKPNGGKSTNTSLKKNKNGKPQRMCGAWHWKDISDKIAAKRISDSRFDKIMKDVIRRASESSYNSNSTVSNSANTAEVPSNWDAAAVPSGVHTYAL
ncbi:hypothetical protein BU25DRAFT_461124 [Macroventuria anomochaeta]|uniref:Uncharacterized protein n=1 Tax=Macroventuria anomochaeta TaxID=301207 RepID=A0ACB6RS46_9PLEO|nr:uncharacterized protein BU25DRAFT_461124 [Macroventuria anomochaeta]KAF2624604.1 hypothetical protein BU25DRAFT_461124 [Macroventuria anomochaeta]